MLLHVLFSIVYVAVVCFLGYTGVLTIQRQNATYQDLEAALRSARKGLDALRTEDEIVAAVESMDDNATTAETRDRREADHGGKSRSAEPTRLTRKVAWKGAEPLLFGRHESDHAFRQLDRDDDGTLSHDEVRAGLRERQLPASDEAIAAFFAQADVNKDVLSSPLEPKTF